mmetsp:Transcript_89614/g.238027  ORF Transcript_89614/g.238027 Transcript_89614/m.238027 type:complete len:259 (+) Transcript_89614:436-1212(+)
MCTHLANNKGVVLHPHPHVHGVNRRCLHFALRVCRPLRTSGFDGSVRDLVVLPPLGNHQPSLLEQQPYKACGGRTRRRRIRGRLARIANLQLALEGAALDDMKGHVLGAAHDGRPRQPSLDPRRVLRVEPVRQGAAGAVGPVEQGDTTRAFRHRQELGGRVDPNVQVLLILAPAGFRPARDTLAGVLSRGELGNGREAVARRHVTGGGLRYTLSVLPVLTVLLVLLDADEVALRPIRIGHAAEKHLHLELGVHRVVHA